MPSQLFLPDQVVSNVGGKYIGTWRLMFPSENMAYKNKQLYIFITKQKLVKAYT